MSQKKKSHLPYLAQLLIKLAPKVWAKVIMEPEWKIAGQIIYPNGVVRSLRMYSLDLNYIASADIARDKDFARFFMKKRGYPVAEWKTFFENSWAKIIKSNRTITTATKYAKQLWYPLITKPNSKSMGSGVYLASNEKELITSLREIFKGDRVAIVERYLPGKDYRIVVLDGEIISAYQRIPLSITGDGKSSILSLMKQKQKWFIASGRDTKINFTDPRIKIKLKKQWYTTQSILIKNQKIYLLDNANLSTGGDSIDMTNHIHPSFHKIATQLTKDMGLRMAWVDIMVRNWDITRQAKKQNYYIIEINATPGLDHYVTTGKAQRKIVETMYLKILKALGKKD